MGTRSCTIESRSRTVTARSSSVEVDRHAERRAQLVLPAVTAADGLGLVVVAHDVGWSRPSTSRAGPRSSGFFDRGSTATL